MELLRIVAMFLIVCFHCAYKSGIPFDTLTVNTFLAKSMWYLGELGVNLFMLVTGYFMVKGRFRGNKIILLICQVLFYWLITIAIAYALGVYTFPEAKRDLVLLFFPTITGSYWYVTAYVLIYAVSPWVNKFAMRISQRGLLGLIAVLLLFYSVIPTLFGFLGMKLEGMLSYTRVTWLLVVYLIGAYMRLYPLRSFQRVCIPLALCLICLVVMLAFILLVATHPTFFSKLGISEWAYFWPPNTVPMIALSIGVFGLFLNLHVKENVLINRIASTMLGVYLLHDGILQGYIWRTVFHAASYVSSPILIPYMLFASLCVFAVGIAVDLIRQLLERVTICPILNSRWWARFSNAVTCKAESAMKDWMLRESSATKPDL